MRPSLLSFLAGALIPTAIAAAGSPDADPRDQQLSRLQAEAITQIATACNEALLKGLQTSLSPEQRAASDKLGSELLQMVAVAGKAERNTPLPSFVMSGGAPFDSIYQSIQGQPVLQLTIVEDADAVERAVKQIPGVTFFDRAETPAYTNIALRTGPENFLKIAEIPNVRTIRAVQKKPDAITEAPENTPQPPKQGNWWQGVAANQAYEGLKIDAVRRLLSYTGNGIKIGTLSDTVNQYDYVLVCSGTPADGVSGVAESQLTGDLPGNNRITILNDNSNQSNDEDEGRAMLELIYDLVPGVDSLGFATGHISAATFANNINRLSNNGFTVINDDLTDWDQPIYQDNLMAVAVNNHVNNGGQYFALTYNFGNDSYEKVFSDPDNDNYHNFGGTDEVYRFINLRSGSSILLELYWSQPWGNATTDLDMILFSPIGTQIAASSDRNLGGNPHDSLSYRNATGGTISVWVGIKRMSGSANGLTFKFISHGSGDPDEYLADAAGTMPCHAGTPKSIAIGAVPYTDVDTIESFSGRGPYVQFFDAAGNRFPDAPRTYMKPDFVSVDRVDTSFFTNNPSGLNSNGTPIACNDPDGTGFPNFSGTSAATPNAAAVAVLMQEAAGGPGSITQEQCREIMIKTAVDLGEPSWDTTYGYGRINALGAVLGARGPQTPEIRLYPNQFGVASASSQIGSSTDIDSYVYAFDRGGSVFTTVQAGTFVLDAMTMVFNDETGELVGCGYDDGALLGSSSVNFLGSASVLYHSIVAPEDAIPAGQSFTLEVDGPDATLDSSVTLDPRGHGFLSSNLFANIDIDYIELTAPETALGKLQLRLQPVGFDSLLLVFDTDGNQIASGDTIGSGEMDTATLSGIQAGGTIVVAIAPRRYEGSGNYSLLIDFETIPGQPPALPSFPSMANYIVHPNPVTGSDLLEGANVDVFQTWNAYLTAPLLGGFSYNVESTILNATEASCGLYDSSLARLDYADSISGGNLAVSTASVHGDDFIYQVFGTSAGLKAESGITFNTAFTVDPPPSLSAPDITLDSSGSSPATKSLSGSLSPVGDLDYYHIFVPTNSEGTIVIIVTPETTLDVAWRIYDADGVLVARVNNRSAGGQEYLSLKPTAPFQEYHILVSGSRDINVPFDATDQTGTYDLRISAGLTMYGMKDSDGDGFSDEFELAVGSHPDDPEEAPDFGDFNEDGQHNLLDVLMLGHEVRDKFLTYNPRLDANLDGVVDAADAEIMFRWAVRILGVPII